MPKNDLKHDNSLGSTGTELVIIGIGASAGGLEALRALMTTLPVQQDIAYVIAQHLDPKHSSILASILERDTDLPVIEVAHNQKLNPATIYIIPPGKHAFVKNDKLLLERATGVGPKPSIDRFFLSLAEEKGAHAVGIVLSGTGSDGAHGIPAIKAEGGITIAQDEKTAKFNSMPLASIQTGHVDLILPPEQIGKQLSELVRFPRTIPVKNEISKTDYLSQIFHLILDQTGSDFRDYKPTTIQRRIERRMAVHRLQHLADYVTLLEAEHKEIEALQQDILVSVTNFFRDKDAFAALSNNLKNIVERATDSIRVWVAGCATGEEAYSIAILLIEHLGNRINRLPVQIFATDLDEEALQKARQGAYPVAVLSDIEPVFLEKYFTQQGDRRQVISRVRDLILFARHDLVKSPPFSKLDLVSCRNVLIYFNPTLQERVLQTFHYGLNDNGVLFLGKSETTGASEPLFSSIDSSQRLYQKRPGILTRLPLFTKTAGALATNNRSGARSLITRRPVNLGEMLDHNLVEIYQSDCVLLNSQHEVIYVRGDVTPFLRIAEGRMGLNIFDLIRSEYRHDLRGLLYRAMREDGTLYSRYFKLGHVEKDYSFRFICRRFTNETFTNGLILVFEKQEIEAHTVVTMDDDDNTNEYIKALKEELIETKESLQTTIEELETSNEELQSTYEEAQSTNEELYTSTEELQTSNEELQSTNEELRTLNQELGIKSAEIEQANEALKVLNQQLELEIEERRLAQLMLQHEKDKLRTIIDCEPAWVNVCDQNGVIQEVNPAGLAIMEAVDKKQLIGKRLLDFVNVEFQDRLRSCMDSIKESKGEIHQLQVHTLKGNKRWLEVRTVQLPKIEGEDTRIMSIISDQTLVRDAQDELMKRQEELSHVIRLNTLGAMASGLAHELNQPLSAITNYLNGCERRVQTENCKQEEVLQGIGLAKLQAHRAGEIINHVKHFVKQSDYESSRYDLNILIENAVELLRATGQSQNVNYKLDLARNIPAILVSSIQIEQVLINLMRNALDALQEAKIAKPNISIRTRFDETNDQIKLIIRDNGPGLHQKVLENIFKPFQTSKHDGMGMGLCISRSIIENYGGYLDISNHSDGGAVVKLILPVTDKD